MQNRLDAIVSAAFLAYNAGGPPERANLTHDGKPVPPFDALGPSVRHKWACAASAASSAGAEAMYTAVVELLGPNAAEAAGLDAVRRRVLGDLASPPFAEQTS